MNFNLKDPADARRFIAFWVERYKEISGLETSTVHLSSGRVVELATASDEDAVIVAHGLYEMSVQEDSRAARRLKKKGRLQ